MQSTLFYKSFLLDVVIPVSYVLSISALFSVPYVIFLQLWKRAELGFNPIILFIVLLVSFIPISVLSIGSFGYPPTYANSIYSLQFFEVDEHTLYLKQAIVLGTLAFVSASSILLGLCASRRWLFRIGLFLIIMFLYGIAIDIIYLAGFHDRFKDNATVDLEVIPYIFQIAGYALLVLMFLLVDMLMLALARLRLLKRFIRIAAQSWGPTEATDETRALRISMVRLTLTFYAILLPTLLGFWFLSEIRAVLLLIFAVLGVPLIIALFVFLAQRKPLNAALIVQLFKAAASVLKGVARKR